MNRAYYSATIKDFLNTSPEIVLGKLAIRNTFALEQSQRDAWLEEINILRKALCDFKGTLYFEFSIPRMGQRIDAVLLIGAVIFVLEFKVGGKTFTPYAFDQVWDYALDLKNFHEASHEQFIVPILIATKAHLSPYVISSTHQNDKLLFPIKCNSSMLGEVIEGVLSFCEGKEIDHLNWENGRYSPTPTIVEAAMALYNGHSVEEISRNDASAINLNKTTAVISDIIRQSREQSKKSICFVTGVPGAGKTLVGLNIATTHIDKTNDLYSVFLSGNGPLVAVLREALTRDKLRHDKENGKKTKKGEVMANVKMFIQNVHHFRDECLLDQTKPPIEHVALFDEAQRAWDSIQTSSFMRRKNNNLNFYQSEPEFLVSCLDRHVDWAVIVCLVGGGQEINTGEAGISEWINSLIRYFPDWHVHISSRLTDSEYSAGNAISKLLPRPNVVYKDELHLAVSMRSFRAENVSLLVKQMLDLDIEAARSTLDVKIKLFPDSQFLSGMVF
ncbi:MAG: DNA/RNA helicase domain-containing protein, partial [Syntrophus sp. (in: bacteria)]